MATAFRPNSSNKRIPLEADIVEQMPVAMTSAFQGSVGAEVATKTLQDLPTELMEDIFIKAVVAEVRDRNEAKCGWKQEARHVISRLSKVCSRWSEILTTKRFRLELQKHLGTPPMHLEVVAKHQIDSAVAVTTMNNKIFVLSHNESNIYFNSTITVYDRNDLWNVKKAPGFGIYYKTKITDIVACGRANCLIVIGDCDPRVYALEKWSEYEYSLVLWKCLQLPTTISTLAISAKRSLVLTGIGLPSFIKEYKIYGGRSLQRKVSLREDFLSVSKAIQKSNGNFVFESLHSDHVRRLVEIDARGNIVQQRRLPLCEVPCYDVDMYDRIMMAGPRNMVRMLDEHFQEIQVFAPGDLWNHPSGLHYDEEANEWMLIDDRKYLTVVTLKQGKVTEDNTDFA